ncbi:MAG: shikimate dehydrogenase [Novosphingobium sp.]|nr:shikimate dehydrogenase [Novosphingobium sp.]
MTAPLGTKPYAEVIGDPIAHSKSPLIHNFWLGKLGIEADYRACHVRPNELADYFGRRRGDAQWRGCNVTIPHKEAVAALLGERDQTARAVGAVNTVFRGADDGLTGTNTDVNGIEEAVRGAALDGGKALVLGTGGAARAAFAFLARQNCAVTILARNADKAETAARECGLAARVLPFTAGTGAFDNAALVVNATQLGMKGQAPMPDFVLSELERTAPDALVFDMVYAPLETALLARGRALGRRTSDGLVMLVGQAATAFERFFGRPAPREHDATLREMLVP